jgi:hypothetical protein
MPHEIDTIDPELLARWITEIFGRIREINPGTFIEVQAFPSWAYDQNYKLQPDWSADSRIIGQLHRIRSPRELLAALAGQLDKADALAAEPGRTNQT